MMSISTWDEIRTAYHVARKGTVSGAADALGVHHATVIRLIDSLEDRLGVKLFQRHARGYSSTEAGQDLLQVAQATDDQFSQLVSRIKGRGDEVSGELVVTSVTPVSPRLTPVLAKFRRLQPNIMVRVLTGEEVLRLEYGEAHVALRAGAPPDQPDNVVQPFGAQGLALYASESYIKRHGLPSDESEFGDHYFVGHDDEIRAPFNIWLRDTVPLENIIYRTSDNRTVEDGVVAGAGIGFLPVQLAKRLDKLTQVIPPRDEWAAPMWLVTHVALHRPAKVQSFLPFHKEAVRDWEM